MMKYIFVLLIFTFSFSVSAFSQSYMVFVDSADQYINKKEWDKAESMILQALKKDPVNHNNSLLLSNLATIQRTQKRYGEALKNYSLAIYMTPNAVTLLKNRASLYMEMDSINSAYQDLEKVIELDEKDIESRYFHGMIALEYGDMTTSKNDFDAILKINSKSVPGKEGLALWNKISGNYDNAIIYYNQLIKDDPALSYYINRAECFLDRKQLPNASDDIKEALKINPMDGHLYMLRARLNKLLFQNDDAARDVELAIKYGADPDATRNILK